MATALIQLAHIRKTGKVEQPRWDRDVFDSPVLNDRRRRAIAWLGHRWVLHSSYQLQEKHLPANRSAVIG